MSGIRFTFLKLLMCVTILSPSLAMTERRQEVTASTSCLSNSIKLGMTWISFLMLNNFKVSSFKLWETEVTKSDLLMLKVTADL